MEIATKIILFSSAVTYVLLTLVIFIVAWRQIITKIKIMLGKGKDSGVVVELKDNKSFKIHIAKVSGKNLKLGKRYYNVDENDFLISDDFSAKGLIVSENLRSSINPKASSEDFKALDSNSLDSLIKRAIIDGQYSIFELIEKVKKFLPLAVLIVGGMLLAIIGMLIKIMSAVGNGKVI